MRCRHELALVVLLSAVAMSACVVDEDPETPDGVQGTPTTLSERACPEDSVLTYEDFGEPFMFNWCTGCHATDLPEGERQDAPTRINFDGIEDVRVHAARIWARSADHNFSMPPVGGPDDDERELLGEWLACGAPTLADM